MPEKETEIFYPKTKTAWRKWLEKNHESEQSVWLVFYNKASSKQTISWSESVEEALCFGWIDSKKISVDAETAHQFFSKRKAKSTWSKINKDKVEKLIEEGKMAKAGFDSIDIARQNGSWTLLDEVEQLIIPNDLEKEFKKWKGAKEYFMQLSKSTRKAILQWIVLAKQAETRQRRIAEIAELAAQAKKPKQF